MGDGSMTTCSDEETDINRKKRAGTPEIQSGNHTGQNGALKPGYTYTAFLRAYAVVSNNQVSRPN